MVKIFVNDLEKIKIAEMHSLERLKVQLDRAIPGVVAYNDKSNMLVSLTVNSKTLD